jgi:AsmA-like C-terminal region
VRLWPHRWWIGVALIAAIVVATAAAIIVYRWQKPRVRQQIVTILSQQLGADVELGELDVQLGAVVRVSGRGLVLHHKIYRDGPPLVRIESFVIDAPVLAILRKPIHISSVEMQGLRIFIPPRKKRADSDNPEQQPAVPTESAPADAPVPQAAAKKTDSASLASKLRGPSPVVIDRLTSSNAELAIASRKPDRPPRTFLIHDLTLTDAAFDRPTKYDARLTNPKPVGTVLAKGTFGPWDPDEPAQTALTGDYEFTDADLGTIKGIGGMLESTGRFTGVLERIVAQGATKTPDFSLDIGGKPMPLDTVYTAIVDGTNGDTFLKPVRAILGRTHLTAEGGIVHTPGRKGRTIELDVMIEDGRLEDVLRLAIDSTPPDMSGALKMKTRLELPPGDRPVPRRLYLKGEFHVASARFASNKVQAKIDELSRRGRGRPADGAVDNVASDLQGRFELKDGVLTLSPVSFSVRGALIQMRGHYSLVHSTLDFTGTARLNARVSEMVTGWKRFPLKILDPIFAKDGAGAVFPIRVSGPVKKPEFTVEIKKIFKG